nr:glycosyltransferase [uncultured Desulfobacter sp.]
MKSEKKNAQNNLAIVIPAYKAKFFREALSSIECQTCKNFHVYIGDDGSPDDLYSIIKNFTDKMPISYHRFDHNIGRDDLVAHWERCIDLVQDEEWIWFFSDDDTMDTICVEKFYSALQDAPKNNIFHFNVKKITSNGNILEGESYPDYPSVYSAQEFCRDRLLFRQQSFFVEFVFRKSKFIEVGRLQKFDLAWGTDVATCIKLAHPEGIIAIDGAYVYWRKSSYNISPDNSSSMVNRKLTAVVAFFEWLIIYAKHQGFNLLTSPLRVYVRRLINFRCKQNLFKTLIDFVRLLRLYFSVKEQKQ